MTKDLKQDKQEKVAKVSSKAVETEKPSFWQKTKSKASGVSKKQIVLAGLGLVAVSSLATGFIVNRTVSQSQFEAEMSQVASFDGEFNHGYGNDDWMENYFEADFGEEDEHSDFEKSKEFSETTIPDIKVVEKSDLDGTYTAKLWGDSYQLTVKGNQASLNLASTDSDSTSKEQDNSDESDKVVFDLDKKKSHLDGEEFSYKLEGGNLILSQEEDSSSYRLTFKKK